MRPTLLIQGQKITAIGRHGAADVQGLTMNNISPKEATC